MTVPTYLCDPKKPENDIATSFRV